MKDKFFTNPFAISWKKKLSPKDENYYVNQCHSGNRIDRWDGMDTNFSTFHQVEDKVVELQQRVVPSGEDDIDYELNEVIIHDKMPKQ